jgi:S-adenosylmethionine hydrolase
MFGIRAKGFKTFDCTPRLPAAWNNMALKNIHSFGSVFDINVLRAGKGKLQVTVKKDNAEKKYMIKEGDTVQVQL